MNLNKCKTIPEIFDLVKTICYDYFKKDQAGLMVGFADLGAYPKDWIGAHHSLNANSIVLNKKPLNKIPKKCRRHIFFIFYYMNIYTV